MKKLIQKLPIVRTWLRKINNLNERTDWVKKQLKSLPRDYVLLDAGCGSQHFRVFCDHLNYKGQDFGQYLKDEKEILGDTRGGVGGNLGYQYGKLDYLGDIWEIKESNATFDAILCTEVFEHIPYPNEAMLELNRLLKSGGYLIITAPYACLPHFEPYFFYSGFSKQWYRKHLNDLGYEIVEIKENGNAHGSLAIETLRTAKSMNNIFLKVVYLLAALPKLTLDIIFSHTRENNGMIYGLFILARKL